MMTNEHLEAMQEEFALQAQAVINRIIRGNFSPEESLPELGPWTEDIAQVIGAFREGYTAASAAETPVEQCVESARRAATHCLRQLLQNKPDLVAALAGRYIPERYEPPEPPPVPEGLLCPPLPEGTLVDFSLGKGVCTWLDEWEAWASSWAPISYPGFFPAVGVWMLSTVNARRTRAYYGGDLYTPMMIAIVSWSSMEGKTRVLKLMHKVMRQAGLEYLIIDTDPTPPALYRRMSGAVPENYGEMTPEDRETTEYELRFAAQKGWPYDEFGERLRSMLDDRSIYKEYYRLFRLVDDCQDRWGPETIVRGREYVRNPYLPLLAGMTPPDMAKYARRNSPMWGNGLFGRFVFIYVPEDEELREGDYPLGEPVVPSSLTLPLARWHQRLGVPNCKVEEKESDNGKRYVATVDPLPCSTLTLSPEVIDAANRYFRALRRLAKKSIPKDLISNYVRFNEKALRMAMLFASFDGSDTVQLSHFAKAQQLTETWRNNLHAMYLELSAPDSSHAKDIEERLFILLHKADNGWIAARNVVQSCKISYTEAHDLLEKLFKANVLIKRTTLQGTYQYAFPGTPEPTRKSRSGNGGAVAKEK